MMRTFIVGKRVKYEEVVYPANTQILVAEKDVEQFLAIGGWEVACHDIPSIKPMKGEPAGGQQVPQKSARRTSKKKEA
jgi:hypothetical protein